MSKQQYRVEFIKNSPEYIKSFVTCTTKVQAVWVANMILNALNVEHRFKEASFKHNIAKLGWENSDRTHFVSIERI